MSTVRGQERERDRDYGNRSRDVDVKDNRRGKGRDEDNMDNGEDRELKKLAFGERSAYVEQKKKEKEAAAALPATLADVDSDDEAMLAALGLPTAFGSTKGQHVKGANAGMSRVKTKREYRQYMNRKGGFHQNLDKIQ